MKTNSDGSITYTEFEIQLSSIYLQVYGQNNLSLHDQWFWSDVQHLKRLAKNEAYEHIANVSYAAEVKNQFSEDELLRRIALLREAIEDIPEWMEGYCVWCGNAEKRGHAPDCLRQRALEETK